jgi:hypothetical protein
MRNKVISLILEINNLARLDIFKPSRKRKYVEARSLFVHIMFKYYKYRLRDLVEIFAGRGYPITHASIIYSIKSFEIYIKYNQDLQAWYEAIMLDLDEDLGEARIDFIVPKLKYLSEDDLLKLSTLVKEMYENAIIHMSLNIDKVDN